MSPAGSSPPVSRLHARPLRWRLLMLAASALIPFVVLIAWGINHLVEERRDETQRTLLELARALSTAVDAELRSTQELLNNLGTSEELEVADLRAFQFAARRTAERLGWVRVTLADPQGHVLMRTSDIFGETPPAPSHPENIAEIIRSGKPMVSPVFADGRESKEVFVVEVPVERSDKLVYVLSATIPLSAIDGVLTRQQIPAGSVVAIFDQHHHRVARTPRSTTPAGASKSLVDLIARGGREGMGRTVTQEGMDSYTAYTHLPRSEWVVATAMGVSDANRGLYTLLEAVAGGLVASLTLSALLAWLLARQVVGPIESLKTAAAALGHGKPVELPKLEIEELEEVGRALQQAAQDRDRAVKEREDASRSKDQFLAMLGHELRNPLAPIASAVHIMALKGDEKTAQERRVIERQLVHVTRLVDDLLDISRITSGRLTIRHEPIRIGPMLTQVVETIRPSLHHRTLTLDLDPRMDHAWVLGDEVRLVQVFNNLLVNAIKFTPPGGSIRVVARIDGDQAQIDVHDTGAGIDPAELDRIFDLFYQAPQSSDRARGGLGLGLPIVRSLVQMHGGSAAAASEGVGHGSRFTVRLPLCHPPVLQTPQSTDAPAQGTARVLVVDDNEDAADTCASLLQMSGYTVRVAYTPESALAMLREFAPQVAILDLGLPGMSGLELAVRVKEPQYGFAGQLIALTGYGQAADVAATKAVGFDAHLTKPVSPPALLDLLSSYARSTEAATAAHH